MNAGEKYCEARHSCPLAQRQERPKLRRPGSRLVYS
jgi:hypothetical protein